MPGNKINPEKLRKIIDSLPFQKKLSLFMRMDAKQRQELILLAGHPEPLVHAINEEELFITIKEIGEDDAIPLISLTSDSQIRYLMDVDIWNKDLLDPSRALKWLELILECGEDKVLQWIQSQDPELVAAIFYSFFFVAKPEEYTEPPEPETFSSPYTLDNIYYLYFRSEEYIQTVARFLDVMRREEENYYIWLMEDLIWGIPSEREESALKWRRARLDEKGFPSLDEALSLYQYLPDRQIEGILRLGSKQETSYFEKTPMQESRFLRSLQQGSSLLSSALLRIKDPGQVDRIHREFIHLCNMEMVSSRVDLGSLEDLRKSMEKVVNFVALGLEILSGGELPKASDIIVKLHLLTVFQAGYTQVLKLRQSSLEILKGGMPKAGGTILGEQLEGILRGICRKRPLFYQYGEYREFRSMEDIGRAREALDTIQQVDRLFKDLLGWPSGAMGMPSDVIPDKKYNAENVLLTAMVHLVMEGRFFFAPISRKEALSFLRKVMPKRSDTKQPKRLFDDLAQGFTAWLRDHWDGSTDQGIQVLERFVVQCLQKFANEVEFLSLDETLDLKAIESLVIEKNWTENAPKL